MFGFLFWAKEDAKNRKREKATRLINPFSESSSYAKIITKKKKK